MSGELWVVRKKEEKNLRFNDLKIEELNIEHSTSNIEYEEIKKPEWGINDEARMTNNRK